MVKNIEITKPRISNRITIWLPLSWPFVKSRFHCSQTFYLYWGRKYRSLYRGLRYMKVHYTCILGRTYFVERLIHLIEEHWLLIITGVQASRVIIDHLLRQYFFVWSEIVGPHSWGNINIEVLLFEMKHSLKGYLFHMFFRFKLPDTVNPLLTPPGSYFKHVWGEDLIETGGSLESGAYLI